MTRHTFIPGTPRPQGSAKAFIVGGKAHITSANPQLNPWRADIHAAVRATIGGEITYPTGPVLLNLEFRLPRRITEPKRSTPAHTRKPDLDKLCRAAIDAIIGLIVTDDAQITGITAGKRTAERSEQPGMLIAWGTPSEPPGDARQLTGLAAAPA
jgi:Holliday junction resolvase RusA-like endonuclease